MKEGVYLLRNDLPEKELDRVLNLRDALQVLLPYEVIVMDLSDQKRRHRALQKVRPTISLDKRIQGSYDFRVSRLFNSFESGDLQETPVSLVSGCELSLEEQVELIPEGKYILVDDDSASGFTIREAKKWLKSRVTSVELLATSDNFVDVVDASDFISPELYDGGLMVRVDDAWRRESYLSPHVNLETRALLPNSVKSFLAAATE